MKDLLLPAIVNAITIIDYLGVGKIENRGGNQNKKEIAIVTNELSEMSKDIMRRVKEIKIFRN